MLDFEGNNVSKIEQLCYLKRLKNLTDLNFKQNPVYLNDRKSYYTTISECCQNLEILDDKEVNAEIFKLNIAQAQNSKKNI